MRFYDPGFIAGFPSRGTRVPLSIRHYGDPRADKNGGEKQDENAVLEGLNEMASGSGCALVTECAALSLKCQGM